MTAAETGRASAEPNLLDAITQDLLANPQDDAVIDRWTRTMVDAVQVDAAAVADHLAAGVQSIPAVRIQRVVIHEVGLGRETLGRELLVRLRGKPKTVLQARLRHTIALQVGDVGEAEYVAAEASRRGWISTDEAGLMAARRALAAYRPELALEHLLVLDDRGPAHRHVHLTALRQLGKHRGVLDVLDAVEDPLTPLETMYQYDALLAVGDAAGAHRLALSIEPARLDALALLNVRSDDAQRHGPATTDQLIEDVRTLEANGGSTAGVLWAYFQLGLLDEMERIEAAAPPSLDAVAKIHLARLHYCRRRFDRALEWLDQVRGLDDSWDAENLRLRVLLETGQATDAIARHTPRTETNHTQVDDALYHALLAEHRLSEAFDIASPWRQRQTKALFGSRAGDGKNIAHVGSRFVISQSGPGDEVLAANLYRDLQELSDTLIITCDPRLESVLTRSFPRITFLPVERLRPRSPAIVAEGRPPRAHNAHFESLTADAMQVAESCDEVILSRNLQHLALRRPRRKTAAAAYLVPDPDRVSALAAHWHGPGPRVGIMWRSELRGPMRDIHYLDVEQLAPFFDVDGTFVSLQYDATDEERAALQRMSGGRVHFPDDLDLRNDFEAALALSAHLSAVVGVCTTGFELAAAGGVPGVLLAPNHFVGWRAMGRRGQDFWHESARLALCDPLWDRAALARAGTEILQGILTGGTRATRSPSWRLFGGAFRR